MSTVEHGPPLPDDVDPRSLDPSARAELRSLSKGLADAIACRLVVAGQLLEEGDAGGALAQAAAARRAAPRIGVVREAMGLAAYYAGEWQVAMAELRAYQRMSGRLGHLAVIADCERALGRPERAVDLYRKTPRKDLDVIEWVELLIVAAGARRDMGQVAAGVAMLQIPELETSQVGPWVPRLRYAYGDALEAAGRLQEAREWFARAVAVDVNAETDAADRLLYLEGVVLASDEEDDEESGATEPGTTNAQAIWRDP